jgi:hypothetical protein
MVAVCVTGVNQAPPYEKDFVDDRDAGGSRSANRGWEVKGIEPTLSPPSALGNSLHLPSLFQPPPQGTGTRTANWNPRLGTGPVGRTSTPVRTIDNADQSRMARRSNHPRV